MVPDKGILVEEDRRLRNIFFGVVLEFDVEIGLFDIFVGRQVSGLVHRFSEFIRPLHCLRSVILDGAVFQNQGGSLVRRSREVSRGPEIMLCSIDRFVRLGKLHTRVGENLVETTVSVQVRNFLQKRELVVISMRVVVGERLERPSSHL